MVYVHGLIAQSGAVLAHGPHLVRLGGGVSRILQSPVLAIASYNKYVAVALEDKSVLVLDQQNLQQVDALQFIANKKPSAVAFVPGKENQVLVADRFGNVQIVQQNLKSEEEDEDENVLVGHFGAVTDIKFSKDGKFMISSDRDDRIRVSNWPDAHRIQSFCLGHTSFVTKVCIVDERVIASASGDGSVRIWDMLNGEQIDCIDLNKVYKSAEELKENPKSTVVVMDLAFESSSKLLFALIEGQKELALIKVDDNLKKLKFVNKLSVNTEASALSVDESKKLLWVMGESPRVQVFRVNESGVSKLQGDESNAKLAQEATEYLNKQTHHILEPLHHIFINPPEKPNKKPKSKTAESAKGVSSASEEDDEE